jgi:hypothetical protein
MPYGGLRDGFFQENERALIDRSCPFPDLHTCYTLAAANSTQACSGSAGEMQQ